MYSDKKAIHPISIAPMMDYTDRHFRMLMRYITKYTLLYTEMISTGAILHGDTKRHLSFSLQEKPVILQLGGDNADDMAEAAKIAVDYGYDGININAGCPSERVKQGRFGVSLMADISNTATIVEKMLRAVDVPITLKCRLGLDGTKFGMPVYDTYEYLEHFVSSMCNAGIDALTIHARIAILGGLSPKQNRDIPPLRYDDVYRIAISAPVPIEINGGIKNFVQAKEHLHHVSAVMIGRLAIENPMLFYHADSLFFGEKADNKVCAMENNNTPISRKVIFTIAQCYAEYLESCMTSTQKTKERSYILHAIRHLIPFFNGQSGARKWRYSLTCSLQKSDMPMQGVHKAITMMEAG